MKKTNRRIDTKILVFGALLCSISIVIGLICKNYFNFMNGFARVTFENFPIIIAGIWFGPLVGAIVGVISDLATAVLSPPYQPNLLISIAPATIGILSGLLSRYIIKGRKFSHILIITFTVHIVGSILIKTPILVMMGYPVYVWYIRIGIYILVASIESYLIYVIVNNRAITSGVERLRK